MSDVFLRNGRLSIGAASRLAAMFASLAEDAGEAASVDVVVRGSEAVLLRRDGSNPEAGEPVTVSAVLAEMAGLAAQIEGLAADDAGEG